MEPIVFDRTAVARTAMRAALQARRYLTIPRQQPINVFDLSESLGLEVRFVDAPSLEGMFSRAPHSLIFLPSPAHRPRGRLAFTCAHELGHGLLGHGEQVDQRVAAPLSNHDPEEYAADVFAGSVLMPRSAVTHAFVRRGLQVATSTPQDLYAIACDLGVGFGTLVSHVAYGLQMADANWARGMKRVTPKSICEGLLGPVAAGTFLVDEHFLSVTIDLRVGDPLVVDREYFEGSNPDLGPIVRAEPSNHDRFLTYRATCPGEIAVSAVGSDVRVRVCRAMYVGPQRNRFLHDPETT